MENNIIRFPIGFSQRKKNELGARFLRCEVSMRWLEVTDTSHDKFLITNVMTFDSNDNEKKLCELVLHKEDILKLAELIKENEN